MATLFCASGGSNTNPYDTWAKAATSLQSALTLAVAGDTVVLQYNAVPSGDAELAADTVYTANAGSILVAASNDGGSAWTPTAMGTANWIGNSTANRGVTFTVAGACYASGLTIRTAGSTVDSINIATTANAYVTLENCYLWSGNTSSTANIFLGISSSANQSGAKLVNCTFRFGNASQKIVIRGKVAIQGGSLSSAGSTPPAAIPSSLFATTTTTLGTLLDAEGFDFSALSTNNLVGDCPTPFKATFANCKSSSGFVALATQGAGNLSGAEVTLYNTDAGDNHYKFIHANPMGSLVVDTGIYANDGATYDGVNHCSWKIVTTANANFANPYVSPWIDKYNTTLSALTPSLEILRDGSTTAYTDGEIWGEWSYQGTSGYPLAVYVTDRRGLAASAANHDAGVGTSGWTGDTGAWSGKLNPTSSITPAEVGHLRGRVCFGKASSTVYVDPKPRGF